MKVKNVLPNGRVSYWIEMVRLRSLTVLCHWIIVPKRANSSKLVNIAEDVCIDKFFFFLKEVTKGLSHEYHIYNLLIYGLHYDLCLLCLINLPAKIG